MKRISLIVPTGHEAVVSDNRLRCSSRCPYFGRTELWEYCTLGDQPERLTDATRTKLCADSEVPQ